MKKLTGIKLINWHAFSDETIEIKNSVLLSGDNGAGKSTILDAIQLVLICSKNNFNKAANDDGKRTLTGYVRYKTGKEDKPFERIGNITSHIALEFREEHKNQSFILGVVIDSAVENSETVLWYRVENKTISDMEFMNGDNEPLEISKFKSRYKLALHTHTAIEAKKDFSNRLGKINEKFFSLIPKSLAFKPIKDVKDFVYNYILEEKDINISALRENIRTYKEFERLVNDIKERIVKLLEIKNKFSDIKKLDNTIKSHEYIILKAEEELLKNEISKFKQEIDGFIIKIDSMENKLVVLSSLKDEKEAYIGELKNQLWSNSNYLALNSKKEKIKEKEDQHYRLKRKENEFRDLLNNQYSINKMLIDLFIEKEELSKINIICKDLRGENIEEFKEIGTYLNKKLSDVQLNYQRKLIQIEKYLDEKNIKQKELNQIISELEKRNLQYPSNVNRLKMGITEEMSKLGVSVIPKVLCELLEIMDGRWKNAVEGYLNTQRFYLLVEKDDFDEALNVYDRLSRKEGLHSAGLINASKLDRYEACDEKSLAYVVTSKNSDAKKYINMILGKVIRCEELRDLKKQDISITPDCMIYKNNVARAIDPKVYNTPYIGDDAYKIQLAEAKRQLVEVVESINELKIDKKKTEEILGLVNKCNYDALIDRCDIITDLIEIKEDILRLIEEKKELEKDNSILDLNIKIVGIEEEIKGISKEKEEFLREKICTEQNLENNKNYLNEKQRFLSEKLDEICEKENCIGYLANDAIDRLNKEKSKKSIEEIKNKFIQARTNGIARKINLIKELEDFQSEYNKSYEFGVQIGIEGIEAFISELNKLEKSTIIEYEEKIKIAKKNAEEEFKEHFISKIQENITNAKREFKELNKALNGITFGGEEYEFKADKNKETKEYYDMIMNDENIGEGLTLFSNSFQSKYKDILDDLFEKLTLDDDLGDKELKKLTDYRTYMNYDIKVNYKDGSYSFFSKVCKEKSGGETQTPYYVAIAASFIQLYKSSLSGDSIGLILFDETFDKMDDDRIMAMMEFLTKLDLQLIIAGPPQRIYAIAPFVNTILLVMKNDNYSMIESLSHEKL